MRCNRVMHRLLIATFGTMIGLSGTAGGSSQPKGAVSLLAKVDHLVYATPDLAVGVEKIQRLLGIQATPGARTAARGASLIELRAEHPDPERVRQLMNQLGLELPVKKGQDPALIATIASPRGRVELR